MKKILLIAASALMLAAVSCQKKPEPVSPSGDPSDSPTDNPSADPAKSSECKVLEFSLEVGAKVFPGTAYHQEKAIVVEAEGSESELLKAVTKVNYTLSEGATINPDPAGVTDYTTKPKFTVTAEDGKTTQEYTVEIEAAMYTVSIAVRKGQKDPIAVQEIGADNDFVKYPGNQVAFVGPQLFATSDGRVYDLDLNYKGDINMDGIDSELVIGSMGNDDNGILIAALVKGEEYKSSSTSCTYYYVWLDGWDKAPKGFYMKDEGNFADFMNVTGDARTRMLITAIQAGRTAHHAWYFDYDETLGMPQTDSDHWSAFQTGLAYNLAASYIFGDSAGETLCPVDADKNGPIVWSHTLGLLSVEDPKYEEHLGDGEEQSLHWKKDGGAGSVVRFSQGKDDPAAKVLSTTDIMTLRGTVYPDAYGTLRYGGLWGFGNLSSGVNIKAFRFAGNIYAAVGHSCWQKSCATVIDVTNSKDSQDAGTAPEGNNTSYLLRSQCYDSPFGSTVSVAYIADPENESGHLVFLHGHTDLEGSDYTRIQVFDLSKKKI